MLQRLVSSTLFRLAWLALALIAPTALGSATNFQLFVIAQTGPAIAPFNVWHLAGSGTNFGMVNTPLSVSGTPAGLALGVDSNLYVTLAGAPISIRRSSGFAHASDTFFCSNNLGASPRNLSFATNGNLYVAGFGADQKVSWFDTNGVLAGSFSLPGVFDVHIGFDGALYAAVGYVAPTGKVARYDWSGSAWTETWSVTNLNTPETIRRYGPYVYYGQFTNTGAKVSEVVWADPATGARVGSRTIPNTYSILGMDFAPDGSLYVTGLNSNTLIRCTLDASGAITNSTVFRRGTDGLSYPRAIVIVDQEMPLLVAEYKFNETGTNCPSTGWEPTPVTMFDSNNVATDLHGGAGSGMLGLSFDRAFNNTASSAMGTNGVGGYARQALDCDSVDAFRSFTLSGWFKTDSTDPIRDYARLMDKYDGVAGYSLLGGMGTPGRLAFSLEATNAMQTTEALWANTQTWVFFAATYDGTLTANNVKLYRGYRSAADIGGADPTVTLMETLTANQGQIADTNRLLTLANQGTGVNRPFDGYLDNIRIHGAHAPNDSRGALSLADLEAIRVADLTSPLAVASTDADGIGTTSAVLNGYLISTGSTPAYVTVYWGRTDGGTNAANWEHTNAFPLALSVGPVGTNVALGTPDATYYYRYYATNSTSAAWATQTVSFIAGNVTVTAPDPDASENGPNSGQFTLSRPGGATNEALTLNYTIGGSASNGLDYTALPVTITLPPGVASTNLTVAPIMDALTEPAETVVLTLIQGAYVVGTQNSATVTIAASVFDLDYVSGLSLWLKSDVGVQTNSSGQVTNWVDQSANAYRAAAPSGREPDYVASVLNGKPSVRFTMTNNDYLQLQGAGTNLIRNLAGATVFAVVQHLANPTNPQSYFNASVALSPGSTRLQIEAGSGSSATEGRRLTVGGRREDTVGYSNIEAVVWHAVDPEVVGGVWDWQNRRLEAWRDGRLLLTREDFQSSPGTNCADAGSLAVRIGAQSTNNPALWPLNAHMMEMVVYTRALSSNESALVQAYLMAKYALGTGIVRAGVPDRDYPPLRVWLKADADGGLVTNASGVVSDWYDLSSSRNHVTQTTATRRPSFAASAIGGRPALTFVRSATNYLIEANTYSKALLRNLSGATIFEVVRFNAVPAVGELPQVFGSAIPSGSSRAIINVENGNLRAGGRRTDGDASYQYAESTPPGTDPLILVGRFDWANARLELRNNGETVATKDPFQTPGTTSDTDGNFGLAVGGNPLNGAYCAEASIAEVLVYAEALSAAQEKEVGLYLTGKYGIRTSGYLSRGSVFKVR